MKATPFEIKSTYYRSKSTWERAQLFAIHHRAYSTTAAAAATAVAMICFSAQINSMRSVQNSTVRSVRFQVTKKIKCETQKTIHVKSSLFIFFISFTSYYNITKFAIILFLFYSLYTIIHINMNHFSYIIFLLFKKIFILNT